jgi:hypothetical protein
MPKVFISYSWTTPQHQQFILSIAERLISDGVEVVLDLYDLKEGNDKYAFMERMVTDANITHVLVFCDRVYAEKANARKGGGVGTESQILSKEVYDKVVQSKIIPIVCEFGENGEPTLPAFFSSRIWIDFSSDEALNRNWEQLIRVLFGKPLHQRPALGKPPAYLSNEGPQSTSPIATRFAAFRQAFMQGKPSLNVYRTDLLDACIQYADELRVRAPIERNSELGKRILDDCGKLVAVRDHITDWILLESANPSPAFSHALINFLERLAQLKTRPREINDWQDEWFEAHEVFVFESFLYVVAALIKTQSFADLRTIFTNRYLISQPRREPELYNFSFFEGFSRMLGEALGTQRYISNAAELIRRQAQRDDITFADLMQAELLALLMAYVRPDSEWYPQTLLYARHNGTFPLFVRATQHKDFLNLATVTGEASADNLRTTVRNSFGRLEVTRWKGTAWDAGFWNAMNMDKLDTLR